MARVRYLGPETATVPELGNRSVEPDEIVEVPDARFEGYACQPSNWEVIEEPKGEQPEPLPPLKKTAAKAPQKGD
ncbi:hypothetical protein ACFU6S_03480 [Streptomyces sp. NPDC057456]|uniref:hypothetical protein n=1 Tax=Streptomyces sp. NPDC057456 TaxID=3346139 RepID=UPI0036901F33